MGMHKKELAEFILMVIAVLVIPFILMNFVWDRGGKDIATLLNYIFLFVLIIYLYFRFSGDRGKE